MPTVVRQAGLSDLDGLLIDFAAKGSTVALEGVEKVGDHDAYNLKVTMKNGEVRHTWVDTNTFLEVKVDGRRRMDGKYRKVETFMRDYKSVQGRLLPSVMETKTEGVKESETIRIESFALNPKLEDSLFAQPK